MGLVVLLKVLESCDLMFHEQRLLKRDLNSHRSATVVRTVLEKSKISFNNPSVSKIVCWAYKRNCEYSGRIDSGTSTSGFDGSKSDGLTPFIIELICMSQASK